MKYEVWSTHRPMDEDDEVVKQSKDVHETTRTDYKAAREDVALFTMFGRKAWIVEC